MSISISRYRSLVAAVMLAAPFSAHAATSAPPPKTFWACYIPGSGVVYRIRETDLKQGCSSADHVMFSWTDGGVEGPQGPVGPQGPPGPQGPKGDPGVSGWTKLSFVSYPADVPPNAVTSVQADCPAGTKAISPSYQLYGISGAEPVPSVVAMVPNLNGFFFVVRHYAPGAAAAKINAAAVCAQ